MAQSLSGHDRGGFYTPPPLAPLTKEQVAERYPHPPAHPVLLLWKAARIIGEEPNSDTSQLSLMPTAVDLVAAIMDPSVEEGVALHPEPLTNAPQ